MSPRERERPGLFDRVIRRSILGGSGLLIALVMWLFGGVYRDREHGEHRLFVKRQPSSKLYFRAPVGEADEEDLELSDDDWAEERAYREQVERGGGWKRSVLLPW